MELDVETARLSLADDERQEYCRPWSVVAGESGVRRPAKGRKMEMAPVLQPVPQNVKRRVGVKKWARGRCFR